ncbi:MAG TPA: glutathione S-transferase family protein [Solirubrobacteraceae bacterium]|nr:glutathione S-transferase family protein [Solirubrobacteraceae bacterium]
MRLYEHPASGNCLKCRVLLRQLGLPFEAVLVDLFRGHARAEPHLARNPDGRVPVLELDDGTWIPESGAILLYLADGTSLLPADRLARARVHQWLFFEQNQIEAQLASARFMALTGRAEQQPEVFAAKVEASRRAMASLERGLADGRPFVAGDDYTVADVALHAYVHCGADAGVDPAEHAHIRAWLRRVEATRGFVNDLTPIPAHAMVAH